MVALLLMALSWLNQAYEILLPLWYLDAICSLFHCSHMCMISLYCMPPPPPSPSPCLDHMPFDPMNVVMPLLCQWYWPSHSHIITCWLIQYHMFVAPHSLLLANLCMTYWFNPYVPLVLAFPLSWVDAQSGPCMLCDLTLCVYWSFVAYCWGSYALYAHLFSSCVCC